MSLVHYDVVEVTVPARLVAGVRARVAIGRVAQEFGPYLNQVYAAARAGAVSLDGQNVFIYRDVTSGYLSAEFCVGATAPFTAVGVVEPLLTPRGVAVMTTHYGDYRALPDATAAIHAWCRAHDRIRAGPSWEVYGHWSDDPAKLRTDVYYLLQSGGAVATAQGFQRGNLEPRSDRDDGVWLRLTGH